MRQKTAFLAAIILSLVAGGTLLAQGYNEDAAISRAFRSVLHRDPYPMEVRRYRILMDENGWEMIINLGRDLGDDDLVRTLNSALQEEKEHLRGVRGMLAQLNRELMMSGEEAAT